MYVKTVSVYLVGLSLRSPEYSNRQLCAIQSHRRHCQPFHSFSFSAISEISSCGDHSFARVQENFYSMYQVFLLWTIIYLHGVKCIKGIMNLVVPKIQGSKIEVSKQSFSSISFHNLSVKDSDHASDYNRVRDCREKLLAVPSVSIAKHNFLDSGIITLKHGCWRTIIHIVIATGRPSPPATF